MMKKSLQSRALFFALLLCLGSWTASAGASELKMPGAQVEETLVTLSAEGVPLKDILKVLSEQTGFSYVASEQVEAKKVSLSFDKVPVKDALRSIASANGLRFEQRRGSQVVLFYPSAIEGEIGTPIQNETRVFQLKYLRLSVSPLDVAGGATIKDLSEQASLTLESSGSSTTTGGAETSATAKKQSNLTAAKGIDQVVASLLTPSGKITIDVHTNSLIVTDTPENLDAIESVLKAIDKPSPQVEIEVYLMEVKKNILTDHGVDWGGTNGALASFTGGSRTAGFPFTEKFFNETEGVKATTQGTSTLTLGTLNAANFTATLRFLTSDTHTRILARPRVLTLNNEAANIKLVTNAAIANTSTLTTAQGQASSTSNVAERTQVGIILKMTPQINEDDSIGLFVEPSITTVAASSFFPSTFLDPTTRTVRTMARVQNNQTLVIGGLLDRNDDTTLKKIPLLGDVPFLGYAFKYKDGNDLDRELLIFITPHIVDGFDGSDGATSNLSVRSDPYAQRVLKDFVGDEMQKEIDAIRDREKRTVITQLEEKRLHDTAGPHVLTTEVSREMVRSLESAARKK